MPQQLSHLVQAERLKDNWYATAADVAALTEVSLQPIITVPIHHQANFACIYSKLVLVAASHVKLEASYQSFTQCSFT